MVSQIHIALRILHRHVVMVTMGSSIAEMMPQVPGYMYGMLAMQTKLAWVRLVGIRLIALYCNFE
jgi:hypothetical protein